VKDELLERLPALGYDEQPAGLAPGDEGLLDRTPAGNDLVARFDQVRLGGFEAGSTEPGRPPVVGPARLRERSVGATIEEGALGPGAERALALGPPSAGEWWPPALRPVGSIEARSGRDESGPRPFLTGTLVAAGTVVARRVHRRAGRPAAGTLRPAPESKTGPLGACSVETWPGALGCALPRSVAARAIVARAIVARATESGPVERGSIAGPVEIAALG